MQSSSEPEYVQLLTPDGRRVEHPDFAFTGSDATLPDA